VVPRRSGAVRGGPSAPPAGHVVFDLDGVVVDSEPTHERANAEYLAGLGATLAPEVHASMLGRRVRDLTDAIAAQTGLPPEEAFAGREAVFWRMLGQAPPPPMPGLRPALARLAAAGLPLAVASSGTRAYVAHVLEQLGVAGAFAAVVSGEEVPDGKPDPGVYLLAAERLGADPADCVAVEDAPHGIAAARAAGMRVVAVPHARTEALDLSQADVVVADLEAAVDWILGPPP
jgi:HAD superfamily hydrolase (TIGR01509 family)